MPDSAASRGTLEARYGVVPLEQVRAMSGLELLQALCDGRLPTAPMCRVFNGDIVEAQFGRVVFEATPTREHLNVMGSVHGGYVATLLDSCLGCSVHSALAAGQGYTTVEVKVNFVRGLSEHTGPVRAEGKVIQVGGRIATAEGRLTDAAGKLLAHGTTTCLIFAI
ncbi:MAG: PaaI family thioesterase [Alphaproteobacteria bacterium]|nr:PaaI family thioesterase [Alphaproteobacteria bacterium]